MILKRNQNLKITVMHIRLGNITSYLIYEHVTTVEEAFRMYSIFGNTYAWLRAKV